MGRPHPQSRQDRFCLRVGYYALILFFIVPPLWFSLPFAPLQASSAGTGTGARHSRQAFQALQEGYQPQQLELGVAIERELAGGQSHSYPFALTAGQYLKLVVDQRGIDVTMRVFGPDGQPVSDFDAEARLQGQERVSWVAEATGNYRLDVAAKWKNAAAGRYEIRMVELRAATETDRELHEVNKLQMAFNKLLRSGKYDEARPLAERALEICERVLGPEHPDVAIALSNLALYCYSKGDYAKVESLNQRSLAIREKALGPDHLDVAISLTGLGAAYKETGDYAQAAPFFQRALAIREKWLDPDHRSVAGALQNLAVIYQLRGDYAKAVPLYQRSLAIVEKTMGTEEPILVPPLNNLAMVYHFQGNYAKAEPLYQRALAIRERGLGKDHPEVATSMNNLANLYRDQGDYAKAVPLYQRALAILEKSHGTDHASVAMSLHHFATLYRKEGDYAHAEPLYQRSLAIREKVLGPDHLDLAETFSNLALLHAAKGDLSEAITFMYRANAVGERNLELNLAHGSERQKLAYLTLLSKQTNLTLSLHSQAAPNDPRALSLALTTLLRRKGRGLDTMTDSIATFRRRATSEDQKFFDQLIDARSQLAVLALSEAGMAKPENASARIQSLEDLVEELEGELSSRSSGFRAQTQPVTIAAVQALLPAGSALIEFAIYTPLDLQTGDGKEPHYLAYLLAAQGQPKWVDLGEAAAIDRAVYAWRKSLRDPKRTDVKMLARAVDEKVMRPVRALLGEERRILIAPDGSLNLIPFAALADENNQYLVERYAISYLTSGRDLLRLQTSEASREAPLVVANPVFGRAAIIAVRGDKDPGTVPAAGAARTQIDASRLFFQPLPGTEDEALAIKEVLPEASILLREQATETSLKQARAPRILHIATHGFFLGDQETTAETRGVQADSQPGASNLRGGRFGMNLENPLLRSGLALAGANRGRNGDDDGVLTALEAAGLDLWGTKLVILSACDTGVGEIKNGEGVQGLRRALVLAGSESQVISLWPVSDETTKDLMIPYYQALQQGQGRSEGLRQVQLRMLRGKDRRHPFYWAAFIQSGEWTSLDSGEATTKR